MKHACLVLVFVCLLLTPRKAEAQMMDGDALLGVALIGIVVGVIVTPFGAMVNTVEGESSKEWGRASLVFGSISANAGGIALAAADGDDSLQLFGGIAIGLGAHGLLWGTISEATLPEEKPTIQGSPRPDDTGATLTIRGSF